MLLVGVLGGYFESLGVGNIMFCRNGEFVELLWYVQIIKYLIVMVDFCQWFFVVMGLSYGCLELWFELYLILLVNGMFDVEEFSFNVLLRYLG